MLKSGSVNIAKHIEDVNELNIFPIPDGDTGDNMSMTLSGCESITFRKDISDITHAVSQSMLMNARGNSGVILSQLFAGFADGLAGLKTANISQIEKALDMAVERAYSAVSKPVEGTILTVAKDSVAAIKKSHAESLEDMMEAGLKEARESLKRTTELLDVLKKAGVVDSGGAGLVYILEGMDSFLKGSPVTGDETKTKKGNAVDISFFTEDSELEFGYCLEFLLRIQRRKIEVDDFDIMVFKRELNRMGNSIVAFKDGSVVKAHIHTANPGRVMKYCQKYGEFLTVKMENMMLQHNEVMRADIEKKYDKRDIGVVAVATGNGIRESFKEFGADEIIFGGQTKNPSSKDFIEAFDRVNAKTIFVLPNNSNVILAAEQAAKLYRESDVKVIPSKTIGDGFAILSMLNTSSNDAEKIENEMMESMKGTVTVEISRSVRDASMDSIDVKRGDYIAIVGNKIVAKGKSPEATAEDYIKNADMKDRFAVMIIRGKNGRKKQSARISKSIRKVNIDVEIYEIYGGQDVYDFLIVLE